MAHSPRDWTVPRPLATLLWWPPISFVLVLVAPDTAAGSIALAGLVLVVLGALSAKVTASLRRPSAAPAAEAAVAEPVPSGRAA